MAGHRLLDEVRGVMRRLHAALHRVPRLGVWVARFVCVHRMLSRERSPADGVAGNAGPSAARTAMLGVGVALAGHGRKPGAWTHLVAVARVERGTLHVDGDELRD